MRAFIELVEEGLYTDKGLAQKSGMSKHSCTKIRQGIEKVLKDNSISLNTAIAAIVKEDGVFCKLNNINPTFTSVLAAELGKGNLKNDYYTDEPEDITVLMGVQLDTLPTLEVLEFIQLQLEASIRGSLVRNDAELYVAKAIRDHFTYDIEEYAPTVIKESFDL